MTAKLITAAQARADQRPQHTPGWGRVGRKVTARSHARRHLRTIQRELATAGALPRGEELVAEANRQYGKGYSASISCRCSDACWKQDCSGLVSGARNALLVPRGFSPICMSSFGFGPMCRAAGRLVSEDYAIRTPGCIGIENAWGSSNGPLGTNGHIVIFTGRDINGNPTDDPGKLITIEEMGTHYGCCHGPAVGRGFNAWAELLDIDYSPLPPPVDWNAVKRIAEWEQRVTVRPLHLGDKRPLDNQMLNYLLVLGGWCPPPARMEEYTLVTAGGVRGLKRAKRNPEKDGDHFAGPAARLLLASLKAA